MKYLLIFLSILMSCSSSHTKSMTREEKEYYECDKIADKITKIYTDQMFREKNLITIGTGGGGPGKLRMLAVSFQTYQKYDTQQVRELLIYCVEQYVKIINDHPEIEKHSRNFPYTAKNVNISIMFFDRNKDQLAESRFISSPFIASAHADEGLVTYWIYPNDQLEFLHQETYEAAVIGVNINRH